MESDRQLVQQVLKGDGPAYARLVERYQHAVFAIALRMTGNRDAAEDAAQNALVSAFSNLARLRDPDTFGAWLLVIARREAIRVAEARPHSVPFDDDRYAAHSKVDESVDDQKLTALMRGLDRLPEHEQQVLMLRYFKNEPVAAIAAITGRSVGTVTKQISRALHRLRMQLGGSGT